MKRVLIVIFSLFSMSADAALQKKINYEYFEGKKEDTFECLFLGDVYYGDDFHVSKDTEIVGSQRLKTLLDDSDVNIANLETAVTSLRASPLAFHQKSELHRGDIDQTPAKLASHGIRVVSLANNHSIDFGPQGLRQTRQVLNSKGIKTFGAGDNRNEASKPYVFGFKQKNGKIFKIAVIGAFERRYDYGREKFDAYADKKHLPGVYPLEFVRIQKAIESIRKADKDTFIVLFPHWGRSYERASLEQQQLSKDLERLEINAIIGHGAHTTQLVVKKEDGIVAFNIGDFFHVSASKRAEERSSRFSFIVKLIKPLNESDQVVFRFYPTFQERNEETPRLVTAEEFNEVLEQTYISREENKTLGEDQHGFFVQYTIVDHSLGGSAGTIEESPVMNSYLFSCPVNETEERTREKVAASPYQAPFEAILRNFEHQVTNYFCAVASGVIVLNTIQEQSHVVAERYTQQDFLDESTDRVKSYAVVTGETRIDGKKDRGLTLDNLSEILKIRGLDVVKRQAVGDLSEEFMLKELKETLTLPHTYVIANFARPLIGQEGAGHFSPLGAYSEENDSFLIVDTNQRRGRWLWIPRKMFLRSMREYNNEIRGYLILRSKRQSV